MKVKLRKMTLQEFDIFYEHSTTDYAKDLMKDTDITFEIALSQAKVEFVEMLPDGLDTKDNSLMVIECSAEVKTVGVLWYLYEVTDGVNQVFLSDFIIKRDERRKGYATATMNELEKDAIECGCTESVLYVSKDNIPGINLYIKCGYSAFRQLAGGMYMKKRLR